jgi:XTP/dITP diphosphohydrolase
VVTLVLATRNPGKVAEMQRLLASTSTSVEIRSVADFGLADVEESGATFEENAILKATTIARATGFPAMADDSGLCVDALNGAPGIFSARWSGVHGNDQANIDRVLEQLKYVSDENRSAHFVCVIALARPDGTSTTVRGELFGVIRRARSGANGFGYDPIFQPTGYDITLAEMSPDRKDQMSHRGAALRKIAPKIAEFLSQ